MKNTCSFLLLLILVAGGISSCKKGENDPFFSLRTRKARIAGEWKLTASNALEKDPYGTKTTTYDGQTETTVVNLFVGVNTTVTRTCSLDYTFRRDGTYTRVDVDSSGTVTTEGTWVFLAKSKEGGLKGKEAIMLTVSSETYSDGTSKTFTGIDNRLVIVIDELRDKKMVWMFSNSVAAGGLFYSEDRTMTFER